MLVTGIFTFGSTVLSVSLDALILHPREAVEELICSLNKNYLGLQVFDSFICFLFQRAKLISKKFDTKLWHNFREVLVKATLKV